jgi:drug/metabolite transporter (DMT)-like permease
MPRQPLSQWTGILAAIGALVLWSIGPILIEILTPHVDSWTQNALRYSIAVLFWLPLLLLSIRRNQFDRMIWRKAALPAVANIFMQSFWAGMFYFLNPAFAVLLSKTSVLWIAGFSMLLLPEERILFKRWRFWLGLVLALAGVSGVLYASPDFSVSGSKVTTGVILALLCAIFWGAYAVAIRISFRNVSSQSGFSAVSLYTAVGLWLAALCFGRISECILMSARLWIILILSGIVSIAIAHVLFYAAVRRMGATLPALVILAQPFLVLLFSNLVFGEDMSAIQLLFGVVLTVGAACAIWAQKELA